MADWKDSLSDDEVNALYKYKTQGKDSLSDAEVNLVYPYKDKVQAQTASLGTALKSSFAGVGNTVDNYASMLAGAAVRPFSESTSDSIYQGMNEREAQRNQWANPNNETIGTGGKIVGAIATLPMQMLAAPFGAASTGKTAVNAGESLPTAMGATAVDTAGNAAGFLLGPGKTLFNTIAKNAGANAAQEYITKWVEQQMMSTPEGKRNFNPSVADAVVAGIVGGTAAGAFHGSPTPEVKPKPGSSGDASVDYLSNIKDEVAPTPVQNPLVDTRSGEQLSQEAYAQAQREHQLAQQSAFNRPDTLPDLTTRQSPMERMASDLGAPEANTESFGDRSSIGDMANKLLLGDRETTDTLSPAEQALKRPQDAQEMIDARNAEHDKIAQNLESARVDMENRKQAANPNQSPTMEQHAADIQAHQDHIAAEEQHRTHLEETHAHALDEQARLEEAQKVVEDRQKAIDSTMNEHPDPRKQAAALALEKLAKENGEPVSPKMAAEANLRRRQQEAPTKSRAQLKIEAKAALEAERTRIVEQRANNESMIQKLRDQHTESEIRTARTQADAQEAVNSRNTNHVRDLMVSSVEKAVEAKKKADWVANLRKEADLKEALKAKQDKVLQAQAKQRAIQEITHPAGSKERAAAVKAVNEKFANKPAKTDGATKKSDGEPTKVPVTAEEKVAAKDKESGLFGADKNGIVEMHGSLPLPKAVRDFFDQKTQGFNDTVSELFKGKFSPSNFALNYVSKAFPEAKQAAVMLGTPKSASDVIAEATRPGITDIPIDRNSAWGTASANLQMGASGVAKKFQEQSLLRGVNSFLSDSWRKSNFQISKIVNPLIKMNNKLTPKELTTVDSVLRLENGRKKLFTEDQLRASGMNEKQIATYTMFRDAFNSTYEFQNKQLERMNEPKLTKEDYYYSARRQGDWHSPITKDRIGADGKPIIDPVTGKPKQDLVWYIRSVTAKEGRKAIAYLNDNFPELNIDDSTKPTFRGDKKNPNRPQDVASSYRDMQEFMKDDPNTSHAIKEAMENFYTEKGVSSLGQNKHFLDKTGIRGFEGDQPWLSPEENANRGANSQIHYLKNAIKWSNTQEAVANIKQVLANPDVIKTQPNAVALSQKLMNRELGLDGAMGSGLENWAAQAMKTSRGSIMRGIGAAKSGMYIQTLGGNAMYSIAAMAQSMTVPFEHILMSKSGYEIGAKGVAKSVAFGLSDGSAGIMAHIAHEAGAAKLDDFIANSGMTSIGKEGLRYMENSGIVRRNSMERTDKISPVSNVDKTVAGMGWTISQPERMGRTLAFMSFVHHLDATGKFANDHNALFQEAELWTDRAMGSHKSFDRPMLVDKMGSSGQLGYVYQSFKFKNAHDVNIAARELGRGDARPLAALVLSYAAIGGLMAIPLVRELDGIVNGVKWMTAHLKPDMYAEIKDMDLRQALLGHLPDTKILRQMGMNSDTSLQSLGTNGVLGEATGLNIGPHASAQVLDTEHPWANIPGAVAVQEGKEWGSAVLAALHLGNSNVATEGLYKNMPPVIRGQMETTGGQFFGIKKGDNPGNQVYKNPNDMTSGQTLPYRRNADDESKRFFGMTSAKEGNQRETWYRNQTDEQNITTALQGNIKYMMDAVDRGNKGDVRDYAKAYMKLDPEGKAIDSALDNIDTRYMSKQEIAITKAKNLRAFQSIKRNSEMVK